MVLLEAQLLERQERRLPRGRRLSGRGYRCCPLEAGLERTRRWKSRSMSSDLSWDVGGFAGVGLGRTRSKTEKVR